MLTVSITVSGKVQGVWYRQSAKEQAQLLGITGQVRNEIIFFINNIAL